MKQRDFGKYYLQARRLSALAFPIFLAQLCQTSMALVDTIMSGRVSATDLAAISVAASIWAPLVLFGNGLLLALPPIVSYLNGSGQRDKIAHQIRQGLWLVLTLGIIIGTLIYNGDYVLQYMKVKPETANISIGYLKFMAFGVPGYLLLINFRGLNDGISKTKPAMLIAFCGLMLNIPLNYIFIYGKLGIPAFGAVGCGIATMIVNWAMGLLMMLYCYNVRSQRDLKVFAQLWEKPDFQTLGQILKLGLPIALAIFSEVMLFTLSSILLAPLGTDVVDSHQIALSTSSVLFIFPLALGMATTITVGQRLGEGKFKLAKQISYLSLAMGQAMALFLAIMLLILRYVIASIFVSATEFPEVILMAGSLLIMTALYQFSDSFQVISVGILRGYKDTKSILIITTFCYWGIGIPLGYTLARTDWLVPALGAKGFWISYVVSLSIAAFLLLIRLRKLQALSDDKLRMKVANG